MSDDRGISCSPDTRLENFAAQFSLAAYHVALRHGAAEVWIEVELEFWRALAETVKKWARQRPPTGSPAEFEVWRQRFLMALTEGAFHVAVKNGVQGTPLEVETDLYRVFRLVLRRYARTR